MAKGSPAVEKKRQTIARSQSRVKIQLRANGTRRGGALPERAHHLRLRTRVIRKTIAVLDRLSATASLVARR
jgi:hypothetical protein